MKNCINCQNLIEDTTKFCPECGTKQPDLPKRNQNSTNSASIGDKNVISGNVIGKNEEYNITGNATINKIEDETKKFITCAVSGKHLLRGRDIVVSCPKCKSEVAQECFNMAASRCFNCDKKAYAQYSEKLDSNLADGMIDAMERIQLDAFALSLLIDSSTKYRLETEAKERKASANLNFSGANSSDLSGFYKIQFKKATELIYNKNDLAGAFSLLSSIHKENIFHDETACLYFLIKAIYTPNEYIEEYEKEDHRAIDIYWKHYWAFVPYLKLLNFDKGFKIINLNKARFSENQNDILLSEVLAFLLLFTNSKEVDYIAEAKSLFVAINKTLNLSLIPLNDLINKLMNSPDAEWETIAQDFNNYHFFYYKYLISNKQADLISHTKKKEHIDISNLDVIIDDKYIKVIQVSENVFHLNFKPSFLHRLDFEFNISNEKIILNSNNTRILITQYKSQFSAIKLVENEQWIEENETKLKYLNLGTGINIIKIAVPNSKGEFDSKWKKNLLSDEDDKDIVIIIEKYLQNDTSVKFILQIGKYEKEYWLEFGQYSINLISNINSNKTQNQFSYNFNEPENITFNRNSIRLNIGDWIICNNAFELNYEGNIQTVANGQLYKVNGFKEKTQQVTLEEFPQLNKANSKTWLPASNFIKLDQLPKINILEIEKGKQLICVSNEYFDNGNNYLISVSDKYLVDTINTNKNTITLMEFPQKNKAEKLKWFSIDNFRILR